MRWFRELRIWQTYNAKFLLFIPPQSKRDYIHHPKHQPEQYLVQKAGWKVKDVAQSLNYSQCACKHCNIQSASTYLHCCMHREMHFK